MLYVIVSNYSAVVGMYMVIVSGVCAQFCIAQLRLFKNKLRRCLARAVMYESISGRKD